MTVLFAAAYDVIVAPVEALGLRAERGKLVSGAQGAVLEIGAGTGLTLAHYPAAVTSVVAAEPDARMRTRLVARAAVAPIPVTVVPSGVPGLDYPDGSFDTIVCVLVLCTVPDLPGSLAELRRLLAPGGTVLFLEHVLGRGPVGRVQHALTPAWARVAGGCQLDRDTITAMRSAGFVITDLERPAPAGRLTGGAVVRGRAVARTPPTLTENADV